MQILLAAMITIAAVLGLPWACAAAPPVRAPCRPPAVPLVSCDPYFSIWSAADRLTDAETTHWTGKPEVHGFFVENVAEGSKLYTDNHDSYLGLHGYGHESVNHSAGEYVCGMAHTNRIELFWAMLKRGYYGTFHSFSVKHLHRYIAEFEARWNLLGLDGDKRMDAVLASAPGLRLTYRKLTAA
jgi:hypothetical protein